MNIFSLIEKNAEKVTGLTVSELREYSPERFRGYLEKKKKKPVFRSFFPIIGRGNVLRDNLVSSEELDSEIDRILED